MACLGQETGLPLESTKPHLTFQGLHAIVDHKCQGCEAQHCPLDRGRRVACCYAGRLDGAYCHEAQCCRVEPAMLRRGWVQGRLRLSRPSRCPPMQRVRNSSLGVPSACPWPLWQWLAGRLRKQPSCRLLLPPRRGPCCHGCRHAAGQPLQLPTACSVGRAVWQSASVGGRCCGSG